MLPLLTRRWPRLEDARASVRAQAAAPRIQSPGFHHLTWPGDPSRSLGVLIVPKRTEVSPPLVIVDQPSGGVVDPPDELPLRAMFASYLEAGALLFRPEGRLFSASRTQLLDLGPSLAALDEHVGFDRDRILLVAPVAERFGNQAPIAAYPGDPTALAGLQAVWTHWAEFEPPPTWSPWGRRRLTLLVSPTSSDRTRSFVQRLRSLEASGGLTSRILESERFRFASLMRLDASVVDVAMGGLRRPAPASVLELRSQKAGTRLEWITVLAQEPCAVRATRSDDEISLEPIGTGPPRLAADLILPWEMKRPVVRWRGGVVEADASADGVEEFFLGLRHEAQTGRPARTILRLR